MPNIMVVADNANGGDATVFLAERLMTVRWKMPTSRHSSSSASGGPARTPRNHGDPPATDGSSAAKPIGRYTRYKNV